MYSATIEFYIFEKLYHATLLKCYFVLIWLACDYFSFAVHTKRFMTHFKYVVFCHIYIFISSIFKNYCLNIYNFNNDPKVTN